MTDGVSAGRVWRTVPLERIKRSWKEPPGYCCRVEQVILKLWPLMTEPAGASADVLYQCWGVKSSTVDQTIKNETVKRVNQCQNFKIMSKKMDKWRKIQHGFSFGQNTLKTKIAKRIHSPIPITEFGCFNHFNIHRYIKSSP